MRFMSHNWSATKQRLRPQSIAEISHHSVLLFVAGQDSTMWDIVWVSPQGHRSVSGSRHFLLQAPQCPCSVRKRFSRDHCCRGRSKSGCRIVGSHTLAYKALHTGQPPYLSELLQHYEPMHGLCDLPLLFNSLFHDTTLNLARVYFESQHQKS